MGAPESHHRGIRSYVLRGGRLTEGQARALETLMPRYGIEFRDRPLDLDAAFGRPAPVICEIGFGNGEALVEAARSRPDHNVLGIEVHPPGVGRVLLEAERYDLDNLRVIRHDAVEVFRRGLMPGSLARIRIWFPDPWPKKRHHKRRLIQPGFARVLVDRLESGGELHLATDWTPYAESMLAVLNARPELENLSESGDYIERPPWRPETRFERRGRRKGHRVHDLLFKKR